MQLYALTDNSEDEDEKICSSVVEWPNFLSEPNYQEISDKRKILPSCDDHRAEEIANKSIK